MLWLCAHLPQLALEALASGDPQLAVTAERGSRRWIVAARGTIAPGTPLAAALAVEPCLRAVPRKLAAEQQQLKSLACWAYVYSSQVTCERREGSGDYGIPQHLLWLEIGASLRLFGGLEALLQKFSGELAAQEHVFSLGIAPTLEGSALLARAGVTRPLTTLQALRETLAPLPLDALMLDRGVCEELQGAGLRCIGELLALPRDGLVRRFPASLLTYLDRLLGRAGDPRRFIRPPPAFARRFELLGEVDTVEGLLFALRRLLTELQHYLRARDTGVQAFTLAFEHAHAPATAIELRLVAPSRDAQHFLLLVRERLTRAPLPAPVIALKLSAQRFAVPEQPQLDLFGEERRAREEWRQLLEKLIARLGSEAVFGLGLVADHRPEKSWMPLAPEATGVAAQFPPRPVWLLREPRPLPHAPERLDGAELIEAGWWDGGDVRRQYYTAVSQGARLWVYQDLATRRWYLHGLWA